MNTPLTDVDETKLIDGLNFQQFMDDPDRVRDLAIKAGWKGEEYKHYVSRKGRLTGRVIVKNRPLNNGDLYEFSKWLYRMENDK